MRTQAGLVRLSSRCDCRVLAAREVALLGRLLPRGFSLKSLRESVPERLTRSPFSARGVLVSSNNRRVDNRNFIFDLEVIRIDLNCGEENLPDARLRPVVESIVNALPRPETLREVSPRNTGLRSIEDRIDEHSIADLRLGSRTTAIQCCFDLLPLLVGQGMSSHPGL